MENSDLLRRAEDLLRRCDMCDAAVCEGDILSLRGRGKGRITGLGGTSRKGRRFVNSEVFL